MLTKKQQEIRRNAIGASDAAAILGIDPWKTPLELYLEKLGVIEQQEEKFGSPIYWGNLLECRVAKAYEDCMGIKGRKSLMTLRHKKHDFIICHLDRKVEGQRKILECKTSNSFASDKWGESGTDEVPLNYLVQVQHQMAVTGYDEADIAVLIGGTEFRYFTIKRDNDIINKIITEEVNFWNNHILAKIAPEPSCRKDVQLLYKESNELVIDAEDSIAESVEQLTEIKNKSKEHKSIKGRLEDKITLFMKDATSLQYNGKEIVSWKADKNGRRQLRVK